MSNKMPSILSRISNKLSWNYRYLVDQEVKQFIIAVYKNQEVNGLRKFLVIISFGKI